MVRRCQNWLKSMSLGSISHYPSLQFPASKAPASKISSSSARRSAPPPSQGVESNIPQTWNQFKGCLTKWVITIPRRFVVSCDLLLFAGLRYHPGIYMYITYIYIYIIDTHTHLKSFENQFITIFGIIFGWLCCIIPILMIQDVDITRIGPMPKFEQIIQRLFSLHRWNHSIYSRWWVTPGIVNSVAHHGLNWPTYFVVWTTVEFPWIESHLEQMVFAETNQIA